MRDRLGPLNGIPLEQVITILGMEGLVVEGAHANGVTEVSLTKQGEPAKTLKVRPKVLWRTGEVEPVTLYYPIR